MNEILDLIPLIKLFLYINVLSTILFFLALLVYAIKKGMLKFAFRKNDLWTLQEKYERLERELSFLKDDILIYFTKTKHGKK